MNRASVLRGLGLWLALCVAWSWLGWHRKGGELYDGSMTDHVSHLNRTRLFFHVGPEIWTTPARELVALPDGAINWPELPTMYPVGMIVLHAPFAWVVDHFGVASERVGFFEILFYLLGFAFFAEFLFTNARGKSWIDAVILFAYGFGTLGFVLRGFYDVWPLLVLLSAFRFGAEKKDGWAVLLWTIAAVMHYRTYFTFPMVLWWFWRAPKDWKVGVAAVLGVASLTTFAMSARFLTLLPDNNPLHTPLALVPMVVVTAIYAGWKVRLRRWEDLASVSGVVLCAALARQVMSWHPVIPLAAMVSHQPDERAVERYARYAVLLLLSLIGLRGEWPFRWPTFL